MIELVYGSAAIEDSIFVADFENCRFPIDQFRHADHIRLAWIYIRLHEYEVAEARMRQSIQGFAHNLGAEQKYHETITMVWMRLVNIAVQLSSRMDKFVNFAHAHAWLLDKEAIFEFYSRDLLLSDTARKSWVDPNLKPIPALSSRVHQTIQLTVC